MYQKKPALLTQEYRQHRNMLTRVKQLSKKQYYQQSLMHSMKDSRKMWKNINNIINYKTPKDTNIQYVMNKHNQKITEPEQISNLMNKNFVSVAESLTKDDKDENDLNSVLSQTDRVFKTFFLRPLITSDVKNSINSLDMNKSTRSDLPKIKFIKMSINIISPIITSIFNKCITEEFFQIL